MNITISFNLKMSDADLHAWANEYGLDMSEVASDATEHLGSLVREHVAQIMQVREFAVIQEFQVR